MSEQERAMDWWGWRGIAIVILLLWAALGVFVWGHYHSLYDDAYIYLRYVDQLFAGCGLRYNCSEAPVEGFTGPLFLMLLALGRLVTTQLEWLVQIICTLCLAGALGLAVWVIRDPRWFGGEKRYGTCAAVCLAALLGFDHYILQNAVSGLETSLACLLVMLLLWTALDEERRGLRVWLVLLVLVRPESALFCVLAMVLPRARKLSFWYPIVGSAIAIALVRWWIFRDILPNTFWAKAGGTSRHFSLGVAYITQIFRDFPWLVASPLVLLATWAPRLRRIGVYVLCVATLWFLFFLRSGGDLFSYSRLAMPLVMPLSIFAVIGLFALLNRLVGRHRDGFQWWTPALVGACVALTISLLSSSHTFPNGHGFANVKRWKMLGLYLAKHHKGKRIATVPIGAIGYFSRLELIDLVGLTSRPIAKAGRSVPVAMLSKKWIGHERHNTEWVLSQKPDLIVMSKFRGYPWRLREGRAGFFAEWLLLRLAKQQKIPYKVLNVALRPGLHWLLLQRIPDASASPKRQQPTSR